MARPSVRVKICGLCRPEDARVAAEAGADFLGVVFAPGPRRQGPESARRIFHERAGGRVGVFADEEEAVLLRLAGALQLEVLQLHGAESPDYCRRVRASGPWAVWKAVRLRGGDVSAALAAYREAADAVLVEGLSAAGLGGTGAPLPIETVQRARDAWPDGLGLVVAGGLTPENVAGVVRSIQPDVVDVSSGVEARVGTKDPERVRAFVRNARGAR